jgi:hypothetical protein
METANFAPSEGGIGVADSDCAFALITSQESLWSFYHELSRNVLTAGANLLPAKCGVTIERHAQQIA